MDVIERLLRVSPDGGNGMLEFFYGVAAVAVAAALIGRRRVVHAVRNWISSIRSRRA